MKHGLQKHLSSLPTQRFSNMQKAPCLPHEWKRVRCPAPVTEDNVSDFKMSRNATPATKNGHSSKNEHGALVKGSRETSFENGRWRNLCAVRVTKFAGHGWHHLKWTPGLNTYHKNPSVWPHCLGEKTRENASLLTGVHRANLGLRFSQTKRENDKNEVLIVNRYVWREMTHVVAPLTALLCYLNFEPPKGGRF